MTNVCAACFTFRGNDSDHEEHCQHCEEAWYCNEECKQSHWEALHKIECPFMKKVKAYDKMSSKFSKAKLRSLIRLLVKRDLEKKSAVEPVEPGVGGKTGPKFVDVESLIAHDEDAEDDVEDQEILVALKAVIDPAYTEGLEDEYLLKLMSRSECNQFGLWSPNDDLLGLSLHPSASFFNHSCIPNCYSEWSGINLVFKALYPIPAGSELTISYIDAHSQTRQRREELRNAYYFTCICPRCVKTTGKYPRAYYDDFYQRYLRCPKGPGLMRLDSYQGSSDPEDSDGDASSSEQKSNNSKKAKKKRKRRNNTIDGCELPKRVPYGYEIRSCMTCSIQRCSPAVPSIQDYCAMFNIYEPVKYMEEPQD